MGELQLPGTNNFGCKNSMHILCVLRVSDDADLQGRSPNGRHVADVQLTDSSLNVGNVSSGMEFMMEVRI